MATMDELRASVRRSFPELEQIEDGELRDKCVEAWALALSETEYESIEQIPGSAVPTAGAMKKGTQADHLRGVTQIAVAMADVLEQLAGPLHVDRDILIAGALCHDVGKPFEYSPRNRARWEADPKKAGYPAIRHPVYGAHIALMVGLPEAVAHAAGGHSAEGERIERSLENTIIHMADVAFWGILRKAGVVDPTP
jgi:putative nucleotidyltransferase with HDIG domain